MRATISLAQRTARAAAKRSKSTTSTTTTTSTTNTPPRTAPLPYAPSQAQQINPSTHLNKQGSAMDSPSQPPPPSQTSQPPRRSVELNSPEYKAAASRYTRAMIAMPILLLTSYVLYGRFSEGEEAKSVRGRGGETRIVVLDR